MSKKRWWIGGGAKEGGGIIVEMLEKRTKQASQSFFIELGIGEDGRTYKTRNTGDCDDNARVKQMRTISEGRVYHAALLEAEQTIIAKCGGYEIGTDTDH